MGSAEPRPGLLTVAHLGLLQILSVGGIVVGYGAVMAYAWAAHTIENIRAHHNARRQK